MRRFDSCGLLFSAASVLLGGTAVLAQLPGDLDGNGEIDLFDAVEFVACMNGPDGIAVDPTCDPGNFDDDPDIAPDTDVDLRDFAGFQTRFGFGQGPPQIVSFTPAPGEWVVDDIGLTEVKIGFSEPVTVPEGAVDVWLVSGLPAGGTVEGFTTSYDPETFVLTVTFAEALRDDRVTVVVDYTIEDVAGNPLDGEILDPKNASLPSGNGVNGGQGVFRIRVLQGDANRDGVVDAADEAIVNTSLGLCDTDPGFDPYADLSNDGCVDTTDFNILNAASGNFLPVTDGTPPAIASMDIEFAPLDDEFCVRFRFGNQIPEINGSTLRIRQCFLTGPDGSIITPWIASPNIANNSARFVFLSPLDNCEGWFINMSNALQDFSGELLVLPDPMQCP